MERRNKLMQLILDKISVPTESPRISRPRLLNKLNRSLTSCNSTVINGRAGTGKTLLATEFARRCGCKVAWYKVDASDSDPRIFFQYLIASISKYRPNFCKGWLDNWLKKVTKADIPQLAESLVYELLKQKETPLLIVIDDLHLLYDEEWVVPFLSRLVPLLPAEAHLMIIGRILPPAPLWRMRSKQTLSVIEEPTLAFTLEETVTLCDSYGVDEATASEIFEQTRGRAYQITVLAKRSAANSQRKLGNRLPQQVCA
jgi:LuxR family transcriptional regulator, maltose regulon positive regulatory protein